jgi:glucose/arabinose dehydrogenase/PKD repeat protein
MLVLATMMAAGANAAPSPPSDFVFENAVPNVAFRTPTSIAFLPNGQLLVAEKRGVVWRVEDGVLAARPVWSAEGEVLDNGDRGLTAIAVDPQYATNHFLYFLYEVDPDSDGVDDEVATFGRLTRYQVSFDDSGVVDPNSRTVLIGADWRDGFVSASPSHGVACLRWGADGSLLVSCGEGAHYDRMDAGGNDSLEFIAGRADSSEDLGSFRSQSLSSLSGKVLRIDPTNGHGYASNPFAADDLAAPRARVWAYGLRNPFRFCVRPGSGDPDPAAGQPGVLYVGDVGWNAFEEINVADRAGMNFGWPCREGSIEQAQYAAAHPARYGCGTAGTPENPAPYSAPTFSWNHTDSTLSVPFGIRGNCSIGGVFYAGGRYPDTYRGRFFFADFGRGWLRVAGIDSLQHATTLQDFASDLQGPVDLVTDPVSGDLHYVSIDTGQVRRLRYVGGAQTEVTPVARASVSTTIGAAPTTLQFSSLGSYDPSGTEVVTTWSFGDEDPFGSTAAAPTHTYREPGVFQPVLTVSNARGAIARDTLRIVITASPDLPATDVLDAFDRPDAPIGRPWIGSVSGLAVEDSALAENAERNYAVWGGATYGPEQEAFVRFEEITAASLEETLLLKSQGTSWTSGVIQVVYCAAQSVVVVNTYTPGVGFARRGGPFPVSFQPGDVFLARAYSNGVVVIARNGVPVGSLSVAGWPFASAGGRIGFMLHGAETTRLTSFGGGSVSLSLNSPPYARIRSPRDGSFFVAGDRIVMKGEGSDQEDPSSALHYRWDVTILHNNHRHPDAFLSSSKIDSMVAVNHDDGTGVHDLIRLVVTDRGGLTDTAMVSVYPEVDLQPSPIAVEPSMPTVTDSLELSFWIRNRGRMPAPFSRWVVTAGDRVLAAGDTLVAPRDSVRVRVVVDALPAGAYDLRVKVDSLETVFETDETNNALTHGLTVREFPATVILDRFAGADGPLEKTWTASDGLGVVDHALVGKGASGYAIWCAGTFRGVQEAYFDFGASDAAAPEYDLLLKVQGQCWTDGAIQVVYSAPLSHVVVNTFTPGMGWMRHGGPWPVKFETGDQLGARAWPDGRVRVYRNGVVIGETSVARWVFASHGGRIGLILLGAGESRISAFGGGEPRSLESRRTQVEGTPAPPVAVDSVRASALPRELTLSGVYPNPSTDQALVSLGLPRPASVTLGVYDLAGRRIWTAASRAYAAGRWILRWNGNDLQGRPAPAGLYLMKVAVDGERFVRNATLIR